VDDIETKFGGYETRVPMLRTGTLSAFNVSSQQSGIMSTDLTQLGKARDKQLSTQLDKIADSITGQTVVDPKGYLTYLTSFHITRDTDVSDIQKARQLLKYVITTNPK
jgi:pre-mRNA-processing factor 6